MYKCIHSYLLYIFIQFYKFQENISSTVTIMPNQGDTKHNMLVLPGTVTSYGIKAFVLS